MLRPTATEATPTKDYKLIVAFDSGEKKMFDVKPYIKGEWYGELNDINYFNTVTIDGYSVCWENGQDLCLDELYYNSILI